MSLASETLDLGYEGYRGVTQVLNLGNAPGPKLCIPPPEMLHMERAR